MKFLLALLEVLLELLGLGLELRGLSLHVVDHLLEVRVDLKASWIAI